MFSKREKVVLSVISYNIQSLASPSKKFTNLSHLRCFLGNEQNKPSSGPDVVCLQETFLSANIRDDEIPWAGYRLYRCDDASHRAGVSTSVMGSVRFETEPNRTESNRFGSVRRF
jgi:exonuclease III